MTLNLEWTGKDAFGSQPLRDWKVGGKTVGVTRSAGPLTFVTIQGAGHMVRTPLLVYFFLLSNSSLLGTVR